MNKKVSVTMNVLGCVTLSKVFLDAWFPRHSIILTTNVSLNAKNPKNENLICGRNNGMSMEKHAS